MTIILRISKSNDRNGLGTWAKFFRRFDFVYTWTILIWSIDWLPANILILFVTNWIKIDVVDCCWNLLHVERRLCKSWSDELDLQFKCDSCRVVSIIQTAFWQKKSSAPVLERRYFANASIVCHACRVHPCLFLVFILVNNKQITSSTIPIRFSNHLHIYIDACCHVFDVMQDYIVFQFYLKEF